MQRKILGFLLLLLLLLGLAIWLQQGETKPAIARCQGSPVLLTFQGREALWCLSDLKPSSLAEVAKVTKPCQDSLLALPSLSKAEHIRLIEKGDTCELQRTSIPASQRFVLGLALNINEASQADLESLPGVGPSVAKAIIDDRNQNGPFQSVEDLDRVKGIGPKAIERLREFIMVGER